MKSFWLDFFLLSDSSGLHETQHDYLLATRLAPRDWLLLRLRSPDAENMAVRSRTKAAKAEHINPWNWESQSEKKSIEMLCSYVWRLPVGFVI